MAAGAPGSARGAPGPETAPPEPGGRAERRGSLSLPAGAARDRAAPCALPGRLRHRLRQTGQRRQGYFPFPKQKGSDWQDGAQLSPRALPSAAAPRLPRVAGFPGQCPSRLSPVPLAGEATPRPEDLGLPHSTGMLGLGVWSEPWAGVQSQRERCRVPRLSPQLHRGPGVWENPAGLAEQLVPKPRSAADRAPRENRGLEDDLPRICETSLFPGVSPRDPGRSIGVENVPSLQPPTFKFRTEIPFLPLPTVKHAQDFLSSSRRFQAGEAGVVQRSPLESAGPQVWDCVSSHTYAQLAVWFFSPCRLCLLEWHWIYLPDRIHFYVNQ